MTRANLLSILTISLGLAVFVSAQVKTEVPPPVPGAKPVTVEHIKVHGKHLEGNLEGDAVDREVIVFLPPSYATDTSRRYPVVYGLHGYSIGAEQWSQEIHVPQTIEGAFAQGAQEMIVVLPDSKTVYNGSMYSSSVTTGDFENFIARDVVAYIDSHYRTIPRRTSRGLVGHSMGGYVTLAFTELYKERLLGFSLFHSTPFPDTLEKKQSRDKEIELVKQNKKDLIINTNVSKVFADDNLDMLQEDVEWVKEIARKTSDEGIIAALEGMKLRPDRSEIIRKSNIPFMLILGKKDNHIPFENMMSRIEVNQSGEINVLEYSGHIGFIEEPEKSADMIKSFVQKCSGK